MSANPDQPGDRSAAFVRRAHRRRVTWRVLEHAGVGVLIACALGFISTTLLAWRGISSAGEPIVPTLVLLALGAACGAAAGLRRKPMLLDTATDLDRQLRSPDLLSTALLVQRERAFTDAGFVSTVLSLSDARVADVSLNELMVRRFTPRAWAGVGLATASSLVFALMMTVPPTPSSAEDSRAAERSISHDLDRVSAPDARHAEPALVPRNSDAVANGSRPDDSEDSNRPMSERSGTKRSAAAAASARGDGTARTDDLRETRSPSSPVGTHATGRPVSGDTTAQAGVGHESMTAGPGDGPDGVVTRDPTATRNVAPWSSQFWPANQSAARDALRADKVPAAYRDLVKDYFDLDQ